MTKARLHRDAGGMTLIETLVTLLVITGGLLVTLGVFSQMGRATYVAQRKTVLISMAQREMERLRVVSYDQIGLSGPVAADAPARCRTPGTAACPYEAVVDGGAVSPGGEAFEVQGVTGRIYRYVTWRPQACPVLNATVSTQLSNGWSQSQPAVEAAVGDLCPGTEHTKRVTVVITSSEVVRYGGPVRLSTVVSNPDSTILAAGGYDGLQVDQRAIVNQVNGAPPTPTDVYASLTTQSFRLTDTRCATSSRQSPGGGHDSHDTSGPGNSTCSGASQADLMTPEAIGGLVTDALPDLSQEVLRTAVGGRSLRRDDRPNACPAELRYSGAGTARRKQSVHTWATRAPTQNWESADSAGRATLTFWTQTASAEHLPGRLCVTVWRSGTGQVLGTTDYRLPSWPTEPTQLAVSFDLAHTVVPAGERLMVTVRTPSDSGSDLLLLYDHAGYQSELSVTTKLGREIR